MAISRRSYQTAGLIQMFRLNVERRSIDKSDYTFSSSRSRQLVRDSETTTTPSTDDSETSVQPARNDKTKAGRPFTVESHQDERTAETRQAHIDRLRGSTESQIRQRFDARRGILQRACARAMERDPGLNQVFRRRPKSTLLRLSPLNTFYCPIQKCGSTTWKGVFRAIRQNLTMRKEWVDNPDPSLLDQEDAVSFVFVREPYSRLLSAYVDKFFSPNLLYWTRVGRYIVANFRSSPSRRSLQCGHDVTFSEFVRYVLQSYKTSEHREPHFVPIHDHCNFCRYNYTFVGHLETLRQDLPFILKAIRSPVEYTKDFEESTIKLNIENFLNYDWRQIRSCMSLEEAKRRLWRKWQMRGLISVTLPFPTTNQESRTMSMKLFQEAALNAEKISSVNSKKTEQKKAALRYAFSTIPLQDRVDLSEMFAMDFELFGFESTPKEVFPSTQTGVEYTEDNEYDINFFYLYSND